MHPLKIYLAKNKMKLTEFAAAIKTSPGYLFHIMAGRRKPSLSLIIKIYQETEGEVKPESMRDELGILDSLP